MQHFGQKYIWMILGFLFLFLILSLGYIIALLLYGAMHVPVFEKEPNDVLPMNQPFVLNDIRVGLYGKLDSSTDVDIFPLKKGTTRINSFSLLIPQNDFTSLRSVKMAVVGKGLAHSNEIPQGVFPSDYGALLFEEQRVPKIIYNPHTFSSWKQIGTLSFEFPDSGDYYLLVQDAFQEKGNYLVIQEGQDPRSFHDMLKLALGGWKLLFFR